MKKLIPLAVLAAFIFITPLRNWALNLLADVGQAFGNWFVQTISDALSAI